MTLDFTPAKPSRVWHGSPLYDRICREVSEGRWAVEDKKNGFRLIVVRQPKAVLFFNKNREPAKFDIPEAVRDLARSLPTNTVIDGELLTSARAGTRSDGETGKYYAFDLLRIDGQDVSTYTYFERRGKLRGLLFGSDVVLPADYDRTVLIDTICDRSLLRGDEGLVFKRLMSPYPYGDTTDWLKLKGLGK